MIDLNTFSKIFILVCIDSFLTACATPISPTGGPPDESAPQILFTQPETGTTNFTDDKILLHFDEFVERGSLQNALRIEPQFGVNFELDWGRNSVAIEFQNELPDSTTFIVTVSTEFSDLNGNSLGAPFKIAVSTGPDIDKGKLMGTVLDARTGEGAKGKRVLLYRVPADLSVPADYISETDTSGVVHFSYLRQGEYLAFWVDDRNRNQVWDSDTERVQPFDQKIITLKEAGSDTLGTLFIANSDTTYPALSGIGLFSSRRLRLRFSESIILTDSTQISVTDTLGGLYSTVNPLYIPPKEPYILFAQSNKVLQADRSFILHIQNISDQADNVLLQTTQSFTGSSQTDTTAQRVMYAPPGKGIYPDEPVKIIYAKPITNAAIRDSLKVIAGDTTYTDWDSLQIQQNNLLIAPDGRWKKGIEYEIRAWNPALQDYKIVQPTVWRPSDLGTLNIIFADSSAKTARRQTQLLLKMQTGQVVADTSFTFQTTVSDLAPVTYQLILYQDLNGNGEWDSGRIQPYAAPEPYYIRNEIPVQPGFTSDLTVSFKK